MKETKNTTVAISPAVNSRLDTFCTQKGITKKDFISLSLSYFERYGINPNDHESPAIEMEKILKRINDLIRFFKAQERDIINPTFEAITATEERIKIQFDEIAKVEQLKKILSTLEGILNKDDALLATTLKRHQEQYSTLEEKTKVHGEGLNKIANSIFILAKALEDGKDRKGLSDQIKGLFSNK